MELTEQDHQFVPNEPPVTKRHFWRVLLVVVLVTGTIIGLVMQQLTRAPRDFTETITFTVSPGASIQTIAETASEAGLVRSSSLLYATLLLQYEPQDVHAGTYVFNGPMDVFAVAKQLASKETELDLVRITLPEGLRAEFMADIIASSSPTITKADYLTVALPHEGYLFPETYLIPPTMTADELVTLQRDMFTEVFAQLDKAPTASTSLSTADVVTLASIVEREANDAASMNLVAGIFLNRLAVGMPLQADASIEYALDVPLNELKAGQLAAELRELDSPYNTYRNPGLPPTPIGNPGAQALQAVLTPTQSDYFYYLTDDKGEFYYAETLQEHNQNVNRYLR